MAKLFTSHDPFHVHKLLGLTALLNFAYRLVLILLRGHAFCQVQASSADDNDERILSCSSEKELYFDIACVVAHAFLSWTSLLLPLPLKRNFKSPMIWREFRWHSIIFASRSVIGTIISILGLWPKQLALNYLAKLALVMGTCHAAEYATQKCGDKEKRTTNAMAYPDYVSESMQQKIKLNYSMAQMSATISCITEDPTLSFLSLYAIQGAAFLMTLRRKNILSTRSVHFVYQLQLCAAYLPTLAGVLNLIKNVYGGQPVHSDQLDRWAKIFLLGGIHLFAGYLRIDRRVSKLVTWGISLLIWTIFMKFSVFYDALLWFHTHPTGIAYVIFSHINEYQRVFRHYMPIFAGKAAACGTDPDEKKQEKQQHQSLVQDMKEYDMLEYPDRRQRFMMVFCALVATHVLPS